MKGTDLHLLKQDLTYPFTYGQAYAPLSVNKFYEQLDKAIQGDKDAVQYIDDCTINRKFGFDFYSYKYWKIKSSDSVCSFAGDLVRKYTKFRDSQ